MFLNADLIGLPLWMISGWLLSPGAARRRLASVEHGSRSVLDETPAAAVLTRCSSWGWSSSYWR